MKKQVIAMATSVALIAGMSACAGQSKEQTESEKPVQVESADTGSEGDYGSSYVADASLSQTVYLKDASVDLQCAYDSPVRVVDKGSRDRDAGIAYIFDKGVLGDYGAEGSAPSEVLGKLNERVLKTSADVLSGVGHVVSADVQSQEDIQVGSWRMTKVKGELAAQMTGSKEEVPRKFCGYFVVNGKAATWEIVVDDSRDQHNDMATLEDWADKIAKSYRNVEK